jgi:hypothetical protein
MQHDMITTTWGFSALSFSGSQRKQKFLMVDVGMNVRLSVGGVLFHSNFGELFQEEKLNLPPPLLFSTVLKIFHLFSLETKPSHCTHL